MNAAEAHEWVELYNWDDGLEPMTELANDPQMEFATALLMYWRLEGPYLSESGRVNEEARKLRDLLHDRLLAGFYPKGALRYEPAEGLSRTQAYLLRKAGFPEELLHPRWAE